MIPATLGLELSAYLSERHATHVIGPTDPGAVVAQGVMGILLRLVPAAAPVINLIESANERISTTFPTPLGTFIVLSQAAVATPLEHASTVAHEHQHAVQIHARGGVGAAIDYLGSGELRARAEADAYAVGLAVRWFLLGAVPTDDDAMASLGGGTYHLDTGELDLARGVIASHLASMRAGLCPPITVALEVLSWLRSRHPEALAATVLT